MKIKTIFQVLVLCILPSLAFASSAYYVDCSATKIGNGSYANPWNNIFSVNNHSFGSGDDVYFKVDTICNPSEMLNIDWTGVNGDRVIIGAYYGDRQFGLNGKSRPIIDGSTNTVPLSGGMINIEDSAVAHVTVKDLKIQYTKRWGVLVKKSDDINVENCYIFRSNGACIVYATYGVSGDGVDTGTISDNICENSGYPDYVGSGAGIEITAMDWPGSTTNIVVTRNIVKNGKFEGIGFYKNVTNSVAEYNTVRDMKSFHLYVDASQYITFRYNLVYESTDKAHDSFSETEYGISLDNEIERGYGFSGNNEIYGNLIAGMNKGISLGCQYNREDPDFICHENVKIYNNTLVDNETQFQFWRPNSGDSIELKNNISLTTTDGLVHANNYSPAGVTWSQNNFDDPVSGYATYNAKIYDPGLKKTSGWQSLTGGHVDGKQFSLTTSSKNRGNGILLDGYNDRIVYSNYTDDEITVRTTATISPSIGAWADDTQEVYEKGEEGYVTMKSPGGFKIVAIK